MHRVLVNGPASWNTLVAVPRLPDARPQTLFASGVRDGLGGTSAGKAVTLAALGVDVTLHTVLGADEAGSLVRAELARAGVRVVADAAREGRTERHLNLMAADGSRVSIYLELPQPGSTDPGGLGRSGSDGSDGPGGSDGQGGSDGSGGSGERRDADVLPLVAAADAVVLDLADHSRDLLGAVRAAGKPLWCDVHDDDGLAEYQRPFVAAADVLVVSDVRLDDPAAYLRAAVAGGCGLAVCTRGAAGALALDAGGWWDVSAAPAPAVVDTNGAGDAFLAGLLAATLEHLPVERALAWASAAGALAVSTRDLGAPDANARTVAALAEHVEVRRPA